MLGFAVSERTISRVMPWRPADPEARQRWSNFLRNHREVLAAMHFFTVPTATFRVLYVFFVIHHARRTVLHVRVTEHPTGTSIIQQLREAFPFDSAPHYRVFDNDKEYGTDVLAVIEHMGIGRKQITPYSPWQNGAARAARPRRQNAPRAGQEHTVEENGHLEAESRRRDRRPSSNRRSPPSIRVASSRLTA